MKQNEKGDNQMNEHVFVEEMKNGEKVMGKYLIKSVKNCTAKNGSKYLRMSLSDKTGDIQMLIWNDTTGFTPEDEGRIASFDAAEVCEFNGQIQLTAKADDIVLLWAEDLSKDELMIFIKTAPLDPCDMMDDVDAFVDSIQDEDYKNVCLKLLEMNRSDFMMLPAAKSIHHAFVSGLLMHTTNMIWNAAYIADLYGPDVIDRSLLLAGVLLHDIGKLREFSIDTVGEVADYTNEGQLTGHLVIGADMVEEAANAVNMPEDKKILLKHMILSHHGQPEFGAVVRPACVEADVLSMIDMLDSRIEIYREVMKNNAPDTFTKKVFALDNRRVYIHKAS